MRNSCRTEKQGDQRRDAYPESKVSFRTKMVAMLGVLFVGLRIFGAAEVVDGITWLYEVEGSTVRIGGSLSTGPQAISISTSGAITIPSRLGGKPVTSIGHDAFACCNGLTSVTIPSSVKDIGANAFFMCEGLLSVEIPPSVTSIGEKAFYGCSELKAVTIPSSVMSWGRQAFAECGSLTTVTILNGVTEIGDSAFWMCDALTSVTIPSSVTSIGWSAFSGCSGLTSVTIPSSVTSIGWHAFSGCSGLTSVTIPSSVTSIGGYAFEDCRGLTSVVIPSTVTSVGGEAFYGCSSLKSATIPASVTRISYIFPAESLESVVISEGVTSIGHWLFYECSGLKSVSLPSSVTSVEKSTFQDCSSLSRICIPVGKEIDSDVIPSRASIVWTVSVVVKGIKDEYIYDGKKKRYRVVLEPNTSQYSLESVVMSLPYAPDDVGVYKFEWSPEMFQNMDRNYEVTFVVDDELSTSEVVVFPRKVSLTTESAQKVYDGVPLTKPGVKIGESGFVSGECSVEVVGSQTKAGASSNTIVLDWAEGALSTNYEIIKDEGTLTVSKRPVSIVSESAQKVYDGMPLLAGFKIGGSGFVAGECEVEASGAQTAVGTCINTITLNWAKDALSTNYEITKDEGTLTVTKRPVSIVSKSAQKVYDGTPLTAGFDIGGSGLVEGECKVETLGAQTVVGMCKNVLALSWAEGASPMNYEISEQEGALTVLPRKVTLTSGTVSKNCDGVPLSCENVNVSGDGFVGDEGVTTICVGTQTWPGTCNNSFEYSFNAGTETSNYNISIAFGQLTVLAVGEVTLASGVTDIPARAFKDCVDVTEIRIPDSVTSIGANAFAGCTSLVRIDFPAGLDVTRAKLNSWGVSDEWIAQCCRIDDYLVAGATLIQYVGDASVKKLTVPAGIVRIDKRAFALVGGLEEIEFSGTEKYIGEGAFYQDTKLSKVVLHEGIERIGDEAFFGCTKMANVIIPSSVKSVGAHAFKQCTALTNAQISYGVESIGEKCFYSDWQIEQVDIPSTVTNIGVMAFGGDSSIIRAKLRADIRPMSEIFSNYKHIREVGVKICDREIVDGCFRDCVELKDVFWEGNCPRLANDGRELYANTWHGDKNETLTTYVEEESTGWDGIEGSDQLPQAWPLVGSCRCSIAHKDLPTYLCQFDSNGGTLGVQDTYQYSERLVKLPPEPVQSGYKFGGWWTQPNGGLRVTEKTIFIEGVYTYLWAHWIKGHTVFLDPNGGVIINSFVTYVDESVYGVLPSPVRSGYAFDGWLYDGHKVEPDTIMNTKADHTLLAQWRAAQYKVIYHPNGGVGNLVTEERVYGETEVLRRNAFVRPGYEFIGWSTHESATSAEYKDAEPVTSLTVVDGGVIELWAVWKESEAIDPTNVELAFGGDADWFKVHQLVEAQAGGQMVCTPCFWQSGKIVDNEQSDLTTKVFGAGKIGFWWRVDCEKVRTYKWDHLAFFVDNVEIVWTNGVTEWAYFEFAVDGSQEHELIWRYQKDVEGSDGEDCGAVCAIVWTPRLETLEDYAGATNMTLRTDGDAGWFGVKDEVHNQSGSVRSGVITDGQVSSLKSAVDGAGVIRFWWKTDCERIRNYPVDRVLFYVDGIEQAWTNGVSDWVQKHFTITGDGPHNVEWRYVKDEEGSSGRDCVWVSEIEWEPLRVPVAIVVPAEITGGKELVVDESWPASLDAQFGAGTSAAFVEKFGSDLSAALLKPTGKKNAVGEDMYVWQDYVAGTDPTDPKSQFTAKIEMVDGEPVIVWSPKLSEAEAAKRIYTTYGRKTLEGSHGDEPAREMWTPVETPAQGGWRFFKVGVEMR